MHRPAASQGKKQFLIVVTDAAQKLALDSDTCIQILREAGRIDSASPISVVDLGCIPDGLNAAEFEKYLREHGTHPRCA